MHNHTGKLTSSVSFEMPGLQIPSFRTNLAINWGVERNLCIRTWGGLGDQICSEPTIRFALKTFKGCNITLASEHPELFGHLKFKDVFDLKREQPIWENYFPFDTIRPPTDLLWEFMSHMVINCVDFPSLCAFRCTIPVSEKEVILKPSYEHFEKVRSITRNFSHVSPVIVHAGRHWQSKTFPKTWWDGVLWQLMKRGLTPVLIGSETDDNRGTVDVESTGCIDFRNKLSVMESIALLQLSPVLITNDSSPLHMAVSGDAFIGFIATCKHPDHITHWRKGQWSWRMKNLGLGGIWEIIDYCPNKESTVTVEHVPPEALLSWLPTPESVADWALESSIAYTEQHTGFEPGSDYVLSQH